jgi:hypothetical protein
MGGQLLHPSEVYSSINTFCPLPEASTSSPAKSGELKHSRTRIRSNPDIITPALLVMGQGLIGQVQV